MLIQILILLLASALPSQRPDLPTVTFSTRGPFIACAALNYKGPPIFYELATLKVGDRYFEGLGETRDEAEWNARQLYREHQERKNLR